MAASRNVTQLSGNAKANYYSINSQLEYEKERSTKLAGIFSDPGQYHMDRAAAIQGVIDSANAAFVQMFDKLTDDHVPEEVAKARASRHADAVKASLLVEVDTEFPTDIQSLASSLSYAQGPANKANFVKPEPVKRGRPRK